MFSCRCPPVAMPQANRAGPPLGGPALRFSVSSAGACGDGVGVVGADAHVGRVAGLAALVGLPTPAAPARLGSPLRPSYFPLRGGNFQTCTTGLRRRPTARTSPFGPKVNGPK